MYKEGTGEGGGEGLEAGRRDGALKSAFEKHLGTTGDSLGTLFDIFGSPLGRPGARILLK